MLHTIVNNERTIDLEVSVIADTTKKNQQKENYFFCYFQALLDATNRKNGN